MHSFYASFVASDLRFVFDDVLLLICSMCCASLISSPLALSFGSRFVKVKWFNSWKWNVHMVNKKNAINSIRPCTRETTIAIDSRSSSCFIQGEGNNSKLFAVHVKSRNKSWWRRISTVDSIKAPFPVPVESFHKNSVVVVTLGIIQGSSKNVILFVLLVSTLQISLFPVVWFLCINNSQICTFALHWAYRQTRCARTWQRNEVG